MALADGSALWQNQQEGMRSNSFDTDAGLNTAVVRYTSDTAETGTVNMITLPAGKIRIHSNLCRLDTSNDFVTNADLHIGYAAYTQGDGTAVVADDNAFADNLDAGAAALGQTWPLPAAAGQYTEFDSQEGITITVLVDTANIGAASTIDLVVVYSKID